MLYRFTILIVALAGALSPSIGRCELLNWQMTTSKSIENMTIQPSTVSNTLNLSSPQVFSISLPDVVKTTVLATPPFSSDTGQVDLSFKLTIGAEVISQTASYLYVTSSEAGVPSALSGVQLNSPLAFNSSLGKFSVTSSQGGAVIRPSGPTASPQTAPLILSITFTTAPEPSGSMLFIVGGVAAGCRRYRLRK